LFLEKKHSPFPQKNFLFSKIKHFSKDLLLFLGECFFSFEQKFFSLFFLKGFTLDLSKNKKIIFFFFEKTGVNPLKKKEKIMKKHFLFQKKKAGFFRENCFCFFSKNNSKSFEKKKNTLSWNCTLNHHVLNEIL
jgi:hypothetical protein